MKRKRNELKYKSPQGLPFVLDYLQTVESYCIYHQYIRYSYFGDQTYFKSWSCLNSNVTFHRKHHCMFMMTQRSAKRSIYFLDNSAERLLALLFRASHSTAIHLYATGFIYTLWTFIKANLTGERKEGIEYTKILMKTQLLQGADSV